MPKSRVANRKFVIGSSRNSRTAHTLLLQMAKEAEELAAQAKRITQLRESKRVTQPDVAEAIPVSLRAYQAWEAGHADPKGKNLKALAAYFGVSADYIEYGTSSPNGVTPELLDAMGIEGPEVETKVDRRLAEIEKHLREINASLAVLFSERVLIAGTKQDIDAARRQLGGGNL